MSVLQVNIQQVGPLSAENCYRLIYNPSTKITDSLDWGDGVTYSGYSFNLFLATTHEEVTDFCTANNIEFDPENFPNVDFTH